MTERSELVREAEELIALYREVAQQITTPLALVEVGVAIGRALEALEHPRGTRDSIDRAASDLAAAREMLGRIRRALPR